MIDFYSLPDDRLPMSLRALRKILQERGWKAEKLYAGGPSDLILTRPDGKEIRIASSTPPTTSVFALHLANNKLASYALLEQLEVPQPDTVQANEDSATEFLNKYGTIVIKPVDGAHGNGVTTNITDVSQITPAIERAKSASPYMKSAIAQQQLPPDGLEIRVICIGYKFIEAIARFPAHVTGDGVHNLMELIDRENATIRTEPYKSDLAYIDRDSAMKYLAEKQSLVPAVGEQVQVVASCNVGQGGTTKNYSDQIPDSMRVLSEEIAKAAQLPVVGIDFYNNQVIEFNAAPMLHYPTGDETATKAVQAYVDYLEQL